MTVKAQTAGTQSVFRHPQQMGDTSNSTYSDAKIGLMYINNERTFSISGSIGVSRSNYNNYSPFYIPVYSPELRNNQ